MAPLIYPVTKHDADQVIQYVYDEATQTLRTTATAVIIGQPIEVEIDMATDSIKLGDGVTLFTGTGVGLDFGLDVNIINTVLTVTGNVNATNFPTTVSTNYGLITNDTIRTASQIGNATGPADFDAGITTPQTLRTVIVTDQTAIPVTGTITTDPDVNIHDSAGNNLSSTGTSLDVNITNATLAVTQSTSPWVISGTVISGDDKNYGVVGANTLRTAAQIGNATGAADFNAGITTTQTLRVVLPTDQTAIPISDNAGDYAAIAVLTQVARTNASTTLKAANASRKGLILHNDAGAVCYVAFDATASSTAFTIRMTANSTFNLDKIPVYTGIVTGIWASNGAGDMMVTELT